MMRMDLQYNFLGPVDDDRDTTGPRKLLYKLILILQMLMIVVLAAF